MKTDKTLGTGSTKPFSITVGIYGKKLPGGRRKLVNNNCSSVLCLAMEEAGGEVRWWGLVPVMIDSRARHDNRQVVSFTLPSFFYLRLYRLDLSKGLILNLNISSIK